MKRTIMCSPTSHATALGLVEPVTGRPLCTLLASLSLFVITLPASAVPLLLVLEPPPGTNQGVTDTCVIAATNCPQNVIDFTLYGNNATSFTGYSPEYTYTPGLIGGNHFGFTRFDIAIDSGTSSTQSDTLNTFRVEADTGSGWIPLYSYLNGPAGNIGNPQNNGNGFSDYLLQTVDLSSLASGSKLQFFADLTLLTGGPESFFIKVVESRVSAPGSLALLGLGMLGLGVALRPRRSEMEAGLST